MLGGNDLIPFQNDLMFQRDDLILVGSDLISQPDDVMPGQNDLSRRRDDLILVSPDGDLGLSGPVGSEGDAHGEGGLDAGRAGEVDGAAVGFDGAADDAQAEAGAFDFGAVMFMPTVKALEDEGQVMRGDADAVV